MNICRNCGKREGKSKLYIMAYTPKPAAKPAEQSNQPAAQSGQQPAPAGQEAQAKPAEPMLIYGAVRPYICSNCLSGYAWGRIGGAVFQWLLASAGVVLLAWLLSQLLDIAWIGGSFVILGLFWKMIKTIAATPGTTKTMGIAAVAWGKYAKDKEIPESDIVWRGPDCPTPYGAIPFVKTDMFNPDDLIPMEESFLVKNAKQFSADADAARALDALEQAKAASSDAAQLNA
ncbi:hypothetical protein SDC9_103029 [bioreactor metagenome]|uniref:Uncharacterized protein n=1 Tax=bioreactor metagenome TaxID=1076179 RepID=A0A645AT22_9ZZZZ